MQLQFVSSSNVSQVGYDADLNELTIVFHSGGVYTYLGVPNDTFLNLLAAPSIGSYVHNIIKSYPFRRGF